MVTERPRERWLEARIAAARAAILWESLWPRLSPAAAIVSLFLTVSLLGIWPALPPLAHRLLLAAFAAAMAAALFLAWRRVRWPRRQVALRRIEQKTGLAHRPLSGREDSLASLQGAGTRALWRRHGQNLAGLPGRLRFGWPAPGLIRRDPYALRLALLLLLGLAGAVSYGDWGPRMAEAFSPGSRQGGGGLTLDAWISPPAYTGKAPLYLTTPGDGAAARGVIRVPAGSRLSARLPGGDTAPVLAIDTRQIPFTPVSGGGYALEQTLVTGDRLQISARGAVVGDWPIEIVADNPPDIGFTDMPSATLRKALRVAVEAADDYGITAARLIIQKGRPGAALSGGKAPKPGLVGPQIIIDLSLPRAAADEAVTTVGYHDLTAHPWAGSRVNAQLIATDASGQQGKSAVVAFTLPERVFHHPVARQLVALRKFMLRNPHRLELARDQIGAISDRPDRFDNDPTVYFGLRSAGWRLAFEPSVAAAREVLTILWKLALRLEDNGLSLAESTMRAAMDKLAEALDRGAPQEEIEKLTAAVRQALDNYLRQMAEQARQNPDAGKNRQAGDNSQTLRRDSLDTMLDTLRDLSRLGAREAARDLLSNLRGIMENLKAGSGQGSQATAGALTRALKDIDDLGRDQQRLHEDTESRAVGQDSKPGKGGTLTKRQQKLRQRLGKALQKLGQGGGDTPEALDDAGRQMGKAGKALGEGDQAGALKAQKDALQALREGAGEVARALAENAERRALGEAGNSRVDPLGRPLDGGAPNSGRNIIPDRIDIRQARQILRELQRRAGQQNRPPAERNYIKRLLKRF